jgi:hypothetical protein
MNGKKTQFILDEAYRVFMDIDGDLFNDSDYGVFVSNSTKDNIIIEKLNQLAQVALQTDKARLSDIITIFKSNSISEIEDTIIEGEEASYARQQQQVDSQNEAMLQQQQMVMESEERNREWQSNENQLDRDTDIAKAQISSMGFSEDKDMDDNGIIDVLELEKLKQKEVAEARKTEVDKEKLKKDAIEKEKDRKHELEMQKRELRDKEKDRQNAIKVVKAKPKPKPPAKK